MDSILLGAPSMVSAVFNGDIMSPLFILLGAPSMVSACKLSKKWEPRAPKKDGSLRLSPFVFV